ncbi:MAG: glycoside hydrolase family 5 protein [bacterium]
MNHPSILTQILTGLCICCLAMVTVSAKGSDSKAFQINKQLGRGVNLGNALDAPTEGEWGVTLEESYFPLIKNAGFDSVRIPIRWSAHADSTAPYTIDPKFMARAEWAVNESVKNHLAVIINFHHYEDMNVNPDKELPRFLGLWKQVAEHFKTQPDTVVFEILNEPSMTIGAAKWKRITKEVINVIRQSNPDRIIMAGPIYWNSISALPTFALPEEDRNLIATVHYYLPYKLTHQGASWVKGSDKWLGTKWTGTEKEKQAVIKDLSYAQRWGEKHHRPMYLGEFGVFSAAEMDSRARYTHFVVEQSLNRGISFGYWEFCSGFGVYDPEKKEWRKPLLDALTK